MKIKFVLATIVVFALFSTSFAQQNINSFWKNFKTAVVRGDKNAVAKMTKFPLSMPYGVKSVKSKADFIKRYDKIMNLEANAKRCFQAAKLEKQGKYYFISCTFKQNVESSDDRPILYYFEKTKTGWKFTSLDNINE